MCWEDNELKFLLLKKTTSGIATEFQTDLAPTSHAWSALCFIRIVCCRYFDGVTTARLLARLILASSLPLRAHLTSSRSLPGMLLFHGAYITAGRSKSETGQFKLPREA